MKFSLTFDQTVEYIETIYENAPTGYQFHVDDLERAKSPINNGACSNSSHKLATISQSVCSLSLTNCPLGFALGLWMRINPTANVAMDTKIVLYEHGNLEVSAIFDEENKQFVKSVVSYKATGELCPFDIHLPLKAWFHLAIHVTSPSQIHVALNGLTVEDFNKKCSEEEFDGDVESGEIRFGGSGLEVCVDEIHVSVDRYSVNGLVLHLYYPYTHGEFLKPF